MARKSIEPNISLEQRQNNILALKESLELAIIEQKIKRKEWFSSVKNKLTFEERNIKKSEFNLACKNKKTANRNLQSELHESKVALKQILLEAKKAEKIEMSKLSYSERRARKRGLGLEEYLELEKKKIQKYSSSKSKSNFTSKENNVAICPKCHSTSITANKRGAKVVRGVAVGLLAGGVAGIVAGAAGKDKMTNYCMKCGHQWRP